MQAIPAVMEPAASRSRSERAFPLRERRIFILLVCGFGLITALLALDAWVGYLGTGSVRSSAAVLAASQKSVIPLVEELQQLQAALAGIEETLPPKDPKDPKDRTSIQKDLGRIDRRIVDLFDRIPANDPEAEIWRQARQTFDAEFAVIGGSLDLPAGSKVDLPQLASWREKILSEVATIVRANLDRAEANRLQIERITRQQSLEDRLILMACLAVASLFLWSSLRIYKRMTEQAKELSQVSWQLLEKQETLARRLARDLHDELGQALTALKTSVSRHAALSCADPIWVQDCNQLLKESMKSAHEISQLLRPTVLDDFGLDSALAWLCEKFEERHQIRASYASDIRFRLNKSTETQLFRLAQEALTNVARHSRASCVRVTFAQDNGGLRLEIADNGIGLSPASAGQPGSLGLTGMKARVHSIHGDMQIRSAAGRGTSVEVTFPLEQNSHEEANSNSAR